MRLVAFQDKLVVLIYCIYGTRQIYRNSSFENLAAGQRYRRNHELLKDMKQLDLILDNLNLTVLIK